MTLAAVARANIARATAARSLLPGLTDARCIFARLKLPGSFAVIDRSTGDTIN